MPFNWGISTILGFTRKRRTLFTEFHCHYNSDGCYQGAGQWKYLVAHWVKLTLFYIQHWSRTRPLIDYQSTLTPIKRTLWFGYFYSIADIMWGKTTAESRQARRTDGNFTSTLWPEYSNQAERPIKCTGQLVRPVMLYATKMLYLKKPKNELHENGWNKNSEADMFGIKA